MSKKKKRGRPSDTVRIYYGPDSAPMSLYWPGVRVKNATQPVQVNGLLEDALKGRAGQTIACHLSNCTMRNAGAFPHPCLLAAFTKSTALIVTKVKHGRAAECIRYRHSYGQLVDLNDKASKSTREAILRQHPEIAERLFILQPVRQRKKTKAKPPSAKKPSPQIIHASKKPMVPRGALDRAKKAGFINTGFMSVLEGAQAA